MNLFLSILILLLLSVIAYQDFCYRAISWITIPLLFSAFSINSIFATDFNNFLQSFLFNLGFIFFQLIAVTAWFSLKNQAVINITQKYIGWGDILFFVVAAAVFSPVNFILFYLLSIISTLIYAIGLRLVKKSSAIENLPSGSQVPLAGAMALLLFVVYTLDNFSHIIDLQSDQLALFVLGTSV